MSDLSQRIQRVTEDLQAIQRELDQAAAGSPEVRESIMEQMLDLQLMNRFKAAVDHMRHLLWAYIEANSNPTTDDRSAAYQNLRMQRVTEMLRVLKPRVAEAQNESPEAQSFFEVIQSIANTAMDKHDIKPGSGGVAGK